MVKNASATYVSGPDDNSYGETQTGCYQGELTYSYRACGKVMTRVTNNNNGEYGGQGTDTYVCPDGHRGSYINNVPVRYCQESVRDQKLGYALSCGKHQGQIIKAEIIY